jgi:hypothetical protein
MDRALEGHHRYLIVSREVCARRPLVHAHQLAALEREIALTESADGVMRYRVASGDAFELARAAWLDRLANHARVGALVGDRWRARAAALEYAHALEASGHDDWPGMLHAGAAHAAPLIVSGGETAAMFTRLVLNVLRHREEQRPALQEQFRAGALDAYRGLRSADPAFAWSRVPDRPHYGLRTPWTGSGLQAIGVWMEELGGDAAARHTDTPEDAEGDSEVLAAMAASGARWRSQLPQRRPGPLLPDVAHDDVAAPYRALAEATPGDGRAAEATRRAARALLAASADAPSPQHALARLVGDGLLAELAAAPLRAHAEESLERQVVWPDPLVEGHHRSVLGALRDVRTATEVDLVAAHASACFAVEADWNVLYLSSLFGPLRAACTLGADDSVAVRTNLHRAADVTYRLLGLTPWSLLTAPRVAHFIGRVLAPLAVRETLSVGAFHGEGGFDFLGEARVWVAVARAGGRLKEFDARIAAERMAALCERAGLVRRIPSPRSVTLWGAPVAPEDPRREPGWPRRPPIPGIETPGDSGRGL